MDIQPEWLKFFFRDRSSFIITLTVKPLFTVPPFTVHYRLFKHQQIAGKFFPGIQLWRLKFWWPENMEFFWKNPETCFP